MHTIWKAPGSLLRVNVNHQGLWLIMEVDNPQNPKIEVLLKRKPTDFLVKLDYVIYQNSNFEAERIGNGEHTVFVTMECEPYQLRIEFEAGFSLVSILTLREGKSLTDVLMNYWS